MELYIDLLGKGVRAKNKIAFGFVWLALGVVFFFSKVHAGQDLEYTDYIFLIGFVLLGIVFLFQGFGKPLEGHLGKSYLHLTKDGLRLKKTVFGKEKEYLWEDTSSIGYVRNRLYVNGLFVFDLTDVSPTQGKDIKDFVAEIATERGIEVE